MSDGCAALFRPLGLGFHYMSDLGSTRIRTSSTESHLLLLTDSESNRLVPLGHSTVGHPTSRVNATSSNGASVSLKHTTIGDGGYAASDTGVSSMYSDEANEVCITQFPYPSLA